MEGLLGLAAISASGVAMVFFYLVAYVFGNMGAFLVYRPIFLGAVLIVVALHDSCASPAGCPSRRPCGRGP
jgi:hypothetical protein